MCRIWSDVQKHPITAASRFIVVSLKKSIEKQASAAKGLFSKAVFGSFCFTKIKNNSKQPNLFLLICVYKISA